MRTSIPILALMIAILASAPCSSQLESDEGKFFPAPDDGIEGQYIVLLHPGAPNGGPSVEDRAEELTRRFGGETRQIWETALEGFLAGMKKEQARAMAKSPWVRGVFQDRLLSWREVVANDTPFCYPEGSSACSSGNWTSNDRSPSGFPQTIQCLNPDPLGSGCIDNWGLDRLDGILGSRDGIYNADSLGSEVHVYVIDSGVDASHVDFGGRVTGGQNTTEDEADCDSPTLDYPTCGSDTHDYLGHGTHVAGIIAGAFAGVAKDVWIHPLRVIDNSCTPIKSAITGALDWIADNHPASWGTGVVNLSMANPAWGTEAEWEDYRVAARGLAARDDLLLIQSAGNGSRDACSWGFGDEDSYPIGSLEYESTERVLIVGGSDENDGRWVCDPNVDRDCDNGAVDSRHSGSNTGSCLDIFAPAAHIVSTYNGDGEIDDNKEVCRLSGTSMAAPHVSGVAALILEKSPFMHAEQLGARILSTSVREALEDSDSHPNFIGVDSPNRLIHYGEVLFGDGFETGDFSRWSNVIH